MNIIIELSKHARKAEEYAYERNNIPFITLLQGSQNYNLDDENSDVDTKTIVIPTWRKMVLDKQPLSTTLEMPDSSHVDIKDAREMIACYKKQKYSKTQCNENRRRCLEEIVGVCLIERKLEHAKNKNGRIINSVSTLRNEKWISYDIWIIVHERCKSLGCYYKTYKDYSDRNYPIQRSKPIYLISCIRITT